MTAPEIWQLAARIEVPKQRTKYEPVIDRLIDASHTGRAKLSQLAAYNRIHRSRTSSLRRGNYNFQFRELFVSYVTPAYMHAHFSTAELKKATSRGGRDLEQGT